MSQFVPSAARCMSHLAHNPTDSWSDCKHLALRIAAHPNPILLTGLPRKCVPNCTGIGLRVFHYPPGGKLIEQVEDLNEAGESYGRRFV